MEPKLFSTTHRLSTRERIIQSALSLIAEGGTDQFTSSNLIAHAHISKGALYHHFSSLDDVLMAALHYRSQERLTQAEKNFENFPHLKDFLEAFFQEILPFSASSRFVSMLLFFNQKGVINPSFRQELCRFSKNFTQRMAKIIQYYYPQTIATERLIAMSHSILFTLEGISAHAVMQQNETRFEETWRWLVDVIVRDLAPYQN